MTSSTSTSSKQQQHTAIGSTEMDIPRSASQQQADDRYSCQLTESLAKAETRSVAILRIAVISALLLTAAVVSAGVYLYTRNEERGNFTSHFEDSAHQVIESFHDMVERNLGAVASLSTDFTSYALHSNQSFPFVTLPHFAEKGSHFRQQSGSHIVHWLPLVTEDKRVTWEEYANETRSHIDEEFAADAAYRIKQDAELLGDESNPMNRELLDENEFRFLEETEEAAKRPMTVLQDGSGYHSRIWSNGAMVPLGDEPDGSGPYLPTWQRSPISGQRQGFLNMNWAHAKVIGPGLLDTMLQEKKAILRNAAVPIPRMLKQLHGNLAISQYREKVDDYIDGLSTFLAYPVFDKFGDDQQVTGVLATNVYWKILLSHLLPSSSQGIICVVENSFNQTFAYRIDGPVATYLGLGDPHDTKYDHLEISENVNEYLQHRASPMNRAYTTVHLSDSSQYTLRVFPSQDTEDLFVTDKPIVYTVVVIFGFALASFLFLLFSYVVEKRQHIMITKVVENAERVTATERELNEFLAHEVRNPLAAAISASSFVTQALNEDEPLNRPETRKYAREDMEVVNSSLSFINDFLRSMLDIHRANDKKIRIQKAPADVLRDIFEPTSAILHKRVANFQVIVQCPENLIVQTDCLRLKQVILNLVRNSSKFVERGFIRMRADVVNQEVRLYVEDSGPGVPEDKRKELFAKYQLSLDVLSQGTGLGLNLSKKLMQSMDGEIWLDESYDSGIEGYPGSRFVVQLNAAPIDVEATLATESGSDVQNSSVLVEQPCQAPSIDMSALFGSGTNSPEKTQDTSLAIPDPPLDAHLPVANAPPRDSSILPTARMPAMPAMAPALTPLAQPGPDPPNVVAVPASIGLVRSNLQATHPAEPTSTELPDGISVLFVDDDAMLRKLFMRAVKRVAPTTWTIQEAASGEEALLLCETHQFDLIFLDQYMASVDKQLLGTETAEAMRSQGIQSTICGLSANDIRDSFLSSGANAFILKPMPCKADSLREMLCKVLKTNQ